MKTDVVMTMDEYLHACHAVPNQVSPPASDAHHIPITAEDDVDLSGKEHGCRCDRWGHPCVGCLKSRPGSEHEAANLAECK